MSREVRKVPANWEHPKNSEGKPIPLRGGNFEAKVAAWDEEANQWANGFCLGSFGKTWVPKRDDMPSCDFAEWGGPRPQVEDYMPSWPDSERTHYQMYEITTEGTPISPVMESPEELARFCAEHETFFADMSGTHEDWLHLINCGSVHIVFQ